MMKKIINFIRNKGQGLYLPFILIISVLLLLNLINAQPKEKVVEKIKIEYIVKYDTIIKEKPIPINKYIYKTIRDTVFVNNSPTIADIPIERKIYQDDDYRAVISGYKPNIDTLQIFRKDSLIYTTIEREKTIIRDYSRWAISLQGGYGFTKQGFSPFVGIGVSYDLIRFKKKR